MSEAACVCIAAYLDEGGFAASGPVNGFRGWASMNLAPLQIQRGHRFKGVKIVKGSELFSC